jgi:hypothetical protein
MRDLQTPEAVPRWWASERLLSALVGRYGINLERPFLRRLFFRNLTELEKERMVIAQQAEARRKMWQMAASPPKSKAE